MKRFFVSNLLFLVFVNLLVKPFWVFGIDRVVQLKMGTSAYGMYFSILNFSLLFSILTDFGIQNFNTKMIAGSKVLASKYFSNLFVLKCILSLVYLGITIFISNCIGYNLQYQFILVILILCQILLSFVLFFRSAITGFQNFKQEAFLSVLDKLLMIVLASTLIFGSFFGTKLSIFNYCLIQFFAYLITFGVSFYFVKKLNFNLFNAINFKIVLIILKQSWPYALIVFLMTIYYRIDGFLLERMINTEAAGVYAKSYRIYEAVNNFSYLFSVLLLPMFASLLSKKEDFKDLLRLALGLMVAIGIPSILVFNSFSSTLMELFYKSPADDVFGVLMCSILPVGFIYIIGTFLVAAGKIKVLNKIVFVGVLVNVILNVVLIPKYGPKGSAISSLATQSIMAFLHVLVLKKYFPLSIKIISFLRFLGYACLVYALIFVVNSLNFTINSWILMLLIFTISFLLSFIFRVVPTRFMYNKLKMT
ncbi:MAG: oligosaccharide flippase family protein [Bacteroidetes bacterium]|mgnify:CR=1 FL=1|jgi:O-antigen/teichoic acid export membrane protein|nr:oligosaccharide flippase family protein [Bacteroidota bacterium]MBK9354311.1 oligosaccharide flippase family protein [Bacteroidota bacterium]MBP7255761.1 oligosaccharide flippase family protein [Chitinophagales bacterium]